jgi:hypothetical protein
MAIEGEKSMSLNVNPLRFAKPYVAGGCIVFGLFCTMAQAADPSGMAAGQSSLPAMKPSLLAAAGDFGLKLDFGVASQPDECDETVTAESPLITAMVAPESTARQEQPSAVAAKPAIVVAARADQGKSSIAAPKVVAAAPAPQPHAAPAPQTPARTDGAASMQWEIALTDKTLNAALARWAATAGWQLLWELPVDYAVDAHTTIPGTFAEAVTAVTKSMETAEIPMKAIFYQGNKVLRIVAKGVE